MRKIIAFYPNHPSQLWVLKAVADELRNEYKIIWFLRKKDIIVPLAKALGIPFQIISKGSKGLKGNFSEYIKTIFASLMITKKEKIDLWITKNPGSHVAASLMGKKSLSFTDDDVGLILMLACTSFPFADAIISPNSTEMGIWASKTKRIPGNFEMFYLHPERFTPDAGIYKELGLEKSDRFAIIRLVSLTAYHDVGAIGVTHELGLKVIELSRSNGIKVFITSEAPFEPDLEAHRLMLPPDRIHHALYYADFFLGDSQTMTTEAAMLGTPAFRLNSFVGRISAMEEMEKRGIAFGFKPGEEESLLQKLKYTIEDPNSKRRTKALIGSYYASTADPLAFFLSNIKQFLNN